MSPTRTPIIITAESGWSLEASRNFTEVSKVPRTCASGTLDRINRAPPPKMIVTTAIVVSREIQRTAGLYYLSQSRVSSIVEP